MGFRLNKIQALAIGILMSSCAPQKFAGGSGSAPAAKKNPPLEPVQCTEAQLTSVSTSQTSVDQRGANDFIAVTLKFTPCAYQKTVTSLPVTFDLDADMSFATSTIPQIAYQMSVPGAAPVSGQMTFTLGWDFFGNTGNDYGHFESSSPLMVSPQLAAVDLKLILNNVNIIGVRDGSPATGVFKVPLHVKIGEAPAITTQISFSPR